MPKSVRPKSSPWAWGALALGLSALAAPALAQVVVPEVTVVGRWGPNGPRSLSRAVSFADLDLTTGWGRRELDRRIRNTAYELCRELGEQPKARTPPLLQSCEEHAVASAMREERIAFADAVPRGYAVAVPPPAPDQAYVAPSGYDDRYAAAPAAGSYGAEASYRTETVTNGPVPDTVANRERFGGPLSNAGRRTAPSGN
ncbi:MAG TPA: UrcA family protein [Phenylobacterium sp.]|uniref:UrcA family protein n=1 Tax=Phenylobacterium sp. TaxID=1871053 RepID=UPI002B96D3EB|nr:UrcA family protein [Phenylobacterium sp.]HSV02336.1 UrcA family protein [Phenylobacterium sp.]